MREHLKNLAAILCFGVASLGALVLVGWALQIELQKWVYLTFVAMNPMIAVGFILFSFAIFLLSALMFRPAGDVDGAVRFRASLLSAPGGMFCIVARPYCWIFFIPKTARGKSVGFSGQW